MSRLRSVVKSVIPGRVRRFLRAMHRAFVFRRAIRRFQKNPEQCAHPGNPVLIDMVYGWGNGDWTATDGYLADCIQHALVSTGPILECGSGLSTLLIGTVAKQRGQGHWALEHTEEWAARVRKYLNRYEIPSVVICATPLKDYGTYCWYDAPSGGMPDSFALVICDGPPGTIKGGRYGLVPIMGSRLRPGCVVLLDDAGREQERAIAARWATELGASLQELGSKKPYIKMTLMNSP
jgi:predicted O-methyltransferase YrrM